MSLTRLPYEPATRPVSPVVEVNFGSSPPFSLGIEEEFQLVDADSYELVSRSGEIVAAAPDHWSVKPELLQSVIEAATPVARTVAEAQEGARASRARLRSLAAAENALILSAGTHPFSRYEHQEITDEERYTELANELQWVAERELIFGLHVHVGVESAETAIAVANAMRAWLPELLALSVNSPFWQGRETGLASTRSTVFDAMPRSGLPPAFASWDDFARLVERGVRTNSFADYTYLWWDLRPHPKLGTIEVRICDAQTRLASTLTIAALVQSLVATLAERFDRDGSLPIEDTTLLKENKWRAVRHGLDADLICSRATRSGRHARLYASSSSSRARLRGGSAASTSSPTSRGSWPAAAEPTSSASSVTRAVTLSRSRGGSRRRPFAASSGVLRSRA